MAHLVETMAYVGQTPWHGLGSQLPEHQPLEVWAKAAGMDWTIESSPVHYITAGNRPMGDLLAYPEQQVLYRSDTKAPLSVVSRRYQVVQPEEILAFYRDLTEQAGFELDTAGVLKGGRKMWALARTGQTGVLAGEDRINGYLLLATACDGTMATTAQFTSVRVVCNNTLAVSLAEQGARKVTVPHSTRFDADRVKQQLGISVAGWHGFMDRLKALSDRPVTSKEAERFIERILVPEGLDQWRKRFRKDAAVPRAMKQVHDLYQGQGRGSYLPSANGTAFGLLSAVTEFVDHERRARNTDYRLDSAWFGPGAQLKQTAFEEALALVA
ncbi:DUF932 domain-containing protein [Marinobacter sp.]|uniref:DUF932 domain-containing protein n=1 Tax=Marinobacter sp. TaxID=50741 RepID=UPI003A93A8B1